MKGLTTPTPGFKWIALAMVIAMTLGAVAAALGILTANLLLQ
jgi:hypothetical protein